MPTIRSGLVALSLVSAYAAVAPASAAAQRRQRDLITRGEILNSSHRTLDLYQLVRSLRPHFLAPPRGIRTFGAAPPSEAVVYIDGTRAGELSHLRAISPLDVEEVRYLDPSRAENEFGITHSGGAVLVKLFKGPKPDTAGPRPTDSSQRRPSRVIPMTLRPPLLELAR